MRIACGIVVGVLLLSATGCSNNKGKIVGKWQAVSGYNIGPGVNFVMEFAADGKFSMTVSANGQGGTITGTYSLGAGDTVYLKNLSMPVSGSTNHSETITIKGDQLIMKDGDGKSVTFKRI
jgi:uncharacterized protein (TIGR03066 family)